MIILVIEQKEKLSEVEQQLKRAEALQRRRMQVEKAAVHLISVRLSSLTIFLFFFSTWCFVILSFISLYTSFRLTREERAKVTSRKEIEDCATQSKTMKIASSQRRRFS